MRNWIFFIVTIAVVLLLGLLIVNITDRRAEAKFAYSPKVELDTDIIEPRDSIWGLNYPRQYQSYQQTADTTYNSAFLSSGVKDALDDIPELVVLWAGYAFSKDYNQPRGHFYAIQDINETLRVGSPGVEGGKEIQPSTCWTCKSPDVPRLMKEKGVTEFYSSTWSDFGSEIINPIGCADCHDPKTMNLTITRPVLVEAFESMGKDINNVPYQEMRNLVCAQCHVEYYFNKKITGKEGAAYLTLPWKNGLTVEDAERYYDEIDFYDFEHKISKTKIIKAQHPDYEIYKTGVHAKRGVSCADCHMPYKSEGGQKFTDHHIGSPLQNVENSCFVCHRENVAQLVADVYERQQKSKIATNTLAQEIAKAHIETARAMELGATDAQLEKIRLGIRHAQWRWDYSVASHGASFHSPIEVLRIANSAMKIIGDTRLSLSKLLYGLGQKTEVNFPNFTSKKALQEYIGIDLEAEQKVKDNFMKQVVPKWLKEGREREKRTIKVNTSGVIAKK